MRTKTLVIVTAFAVLGMGLQGCAVVALVGAAAMVGHIDSQERKAFAEVNLEREKVGLEPLTWDEYHKPKKAQKESAPEPDPEQDPLAGDKP